MGVTEIETPAKELVRIATAAKRLDLTRRAIEAKIYRGEWLKGREYHQLRPRAAIFVDVKAVHRLLTNGRA